MTKPKLAIACDHGGLELKNELYQYLKEKNYDVEDFGTNDKTSCDYPIYAKKVCTEILEGRADLGILICTTGVGMSIMANRFKGIQAACVSDTYIAKMTRLHNNSNVLCMGQNVVGLGLAKEILDTWLNNNFEGERHEKRVKMLNE